VNFAVFSRHATRVELLLFDHVDEAKAARVSRIDPIENRTYHYWHVFVPRVTAGQLYGFRVEGPSDPGGGWRRWIDTALAPPQDIVAWDTAPLVAGPRYRVEARSVVVLFADASRTRVELALEEAID
jgi:pullulanase/glycogen debranching enzyme